MHMNTNYQQYNAINYIAIKIYYTHLSHKNKTLISKI
jgi:hypothetical protein